MSFISNSTYSFDAPGKGGDGPGYSFHNNSSVTARVTPKEILIIEDSSTARLFIKMSLKQAFPDANIREADDGKAALQELGRGAVQLIVSDLNMPRMDGRTFLKTLRANSVLKKKPVLMITSEDIQALRLEFAGSPHLRFLSKPATPEMIADTVQNLMDETAA